MKFLRFWLILLIASAGFFPLVVLAQENDQEKTEADNEESTDETKPDYLVIVEDTMPKSGTATTKIPVPVQELPASISVVPEELFHLQEANVLNDALRDVSGVNVQTGFGVFDYFTIRGFDSLSSALVLSDGAPEPETTLYRLYNVERVEVLKGPGAFLYGGNPLAGTVNIVRKQPYYDDALSIYTNYGSFQSLRGNLDWNAKFGDTCAFRINAMGETTDRYRDAKDSNQYGINPALNWRINDKSFLNINLEFLTNDYQPDSGIPIVNGQIADVPRKQNYQSPLDTSEQDVYRVRLDYDTQINDSITFRNKFYVNDLKWDSRGTLINGTFDQPFVGTLVFRTLPVLDDHQNFLGNQAEMLFKVSTGSIQHQLLAGLELGHYTDDFTLDVALLPVVTLNNPIDTTSEPLPFIPGQSLAGDARSNIIAPYLIDQIALSDQWKIFAGGRLDHIDFEDKILGTDRTDTKFSPMGGITFSPKSSVSLYFNAGHAFAPPSTLTVGDRKPEESTQYEGGLKTLLLDGHASATFAVYHIERENIAIPDETGVTRQIGDQKSNGFEFDFAITEMKPVSTFVSYAYNDSELTKFAELINTPIGPFLFDRSGNTPAFAPHHILNVWLMKEFPRGFGIGGGPRYVSDQFIAEDNAFKIDGYVTLDASVFCDWNQWRFSVNFKNITDKKYESRGFGNSSVIPADPFAIYGGIQFKL
jgi:TonB-dependent siderophore receptor